LFKLPYQESRLEEILSGSGYQVARPYPHVVIDELFDPSSLDAMLSEWSFENESTSESHNDGTYVTNKIGTGIGATFGQNTEYFLWQLSRPTFLKFLENLTGINSLIPDPYFFGGGLHSVGNGGRLAIHADYNKHFKFKLDRRLNLLVYLNKDWTEANGGCLELWDQHMTNCVRKVLPVFNRTVIFSTSSNSFHGHPDPVICGNQESRKSLALYYYSNGRPEEDVFSPEEHSTLWQARPGKGY